MNIIFKPRGYFTVPDGTDVSAFLNATDTSQKDVPWGKLGEMSIAAGRIGPGVCSWIHMHPVVTQITYIVSGRLRVWMKSPSAEQRYNLDLETGDAVITEPGTLFQLQNMTDDMADVLYMVSPSYVFEKVGDKVVQDDAVFVAKTWDELEVANYNVPALEISVFEAAAKRAESERRLAVQKGNKPEPIAKEVIRSLPKKYDYLAPDGSEIRLLVGGRNGGFAHCVLPAGKVSAPVRHRTVEELWYVLEGEGEIWRGRDDENRVDPLSLRPGDSVRIPIGASFQFRAGRDADLKLLLATMPPWPGAEEAVSVDGEWT